MTEQYFSFVKEYIFSLRKIALVAFLIFLFAIFFGYFVAQTSPSDAQLILIQFQETFEPIMEMSSFEQFFFIFLNNGIALFLAIVLGVVFGIFSALTLLSNGLLLGIVIYFAQNAMDWSTTFILIFPHGIIEIPVIILACATGLKIGKTAFKKAFKKEGNLTKEFRKGLSFFLKFLLPLLAIAAAIEAVLFTQIGL